MSHRNKRGGGHGKGGARRSENNRIYGHSLPLVFSPVESTPSLFKALGVFKGLNTEVLNPHCEGVFDVATKSVWVTNPKDVMILWRRGFFGKGDLSRSEPSWHARQINIRKMAGNQMTSEEVREKRRIERKQFKLDRAKALADAATEADAAFREGREAALPAIPSGATWKPQTSMEEAEDSSPDDPEEQDTSVLEDEEPLEDVEHLQLTLQEAFFLCWGLDCLTILDPLTNEPMTLQTIWSSFQRIHLTIPSEDGNLLKRFDNPFLVHYAVYHHFRSLGWVVKGGIKFCVDYLLYKRGPVFHHAEFAIVVVPVYEDPADQETSPFTLPGSTPFSWSWLSTISRVNSQVQKTLVLAYVTIPSQSRISPSLLSSPACLPHYSVREVVLRRFVPARMRD
ncbi:hypothetical protein QCA50_009169 [Cerrena zonata]|uniref:tRNA-splicing endonuclease subunit Sen2 n=1 Tax=Cerrena zonata TaxID=2478898 RepID=A0AAW0G9Z2_9APHY